ncbi:glycosyltransferase [Candidatus Fermentibacterales bacterium]|nr:glycosyltransferase [Candidatus Fermentibacterales bacterium]
MQPQVLATLFWTMVLLAALPVLVYPAVLVLLSRLRPERRPEPPADPPRVSVLLAARDERECIARRISNILEQDYPAGSLEVLIGSDASEDGMDDVVTRLRDTEGTGRVRLLRSEVRQGKPAILSMLAAEAKGDILVFTDADTVFAPDTVSQLVVPFADARVGCVDGARVNSLEKQSCESAYWRYEKWIKRVSSRLGAVLGATGAVFALRRDLYSPISPRRGDDFELAVMVRVKGYECVFNPAAVAMEPSPDEARQFRRMVRIVSWMTGSALLLLGKAISRGRLGLALQILVHKLLRWLGGFLVAGATGVAIALSGTPFYAVAACLMACFHLTAAAGVLLGDRLPSMLLVPYYFWVMYAASSVGIVRFLTARPVETWEAGP